MFQCASSVVKEPECVYKVRTTKCGVSTGTAEMTHGPSFKCHAPIKVSSASPSTISEKPNTGSDIYSTVSTTPESHLLFQWLYTWLKWSSSWLRVLRAHPRSALYIGSYDVTILACSRTRHRGDRTRRQRRRLGLWLHADKRRSLG